MINETPATINQKHDYHFIRYAQNQNFGKPINLKAFESSNQRV